MRVLSSRLAGLTATLAFSACKTAPPPPFNGTPDAVVRETRDDTSAPETEAEVLLGDTQLCREHLGDLRITTKSDLSQLEYVRVLTGSLLLTPSEGLWNMSVREVIGDVKLSGTRDHLVGAQVCLGALTTIDGDLELAYTTRGLVDLYRVESIGGALVAHHGGWGIWTPALRSIGGGVELTDTSSLGLAFDALETIGGPIRIERARGLERLALPKVEHVGTGPAGDASGDAWVLVDNPDLVTLSLGRLRQIDGDLRITGNTKLSRATIDVAFAAIIVNGTKTICGNNADEACP